MLQGFRLFIAMSTLVLLVQGEIALADDLLLNGTNRINWATVHALFDSQSTAVTALDVQARSFNKLRSQRRHLKHNGQPYQADTITARSGTRGITGVRLAIGNEIVYRFYMNDAQSVTNITFRKNDLQAQIDQLPLPTEHEDDAVPVAPTFDGNTPPTTAAVQGVTSTLKMMVVFTTASLNQSGGLANMLAAINASIAESNTTFTNSLIDAQVVLVHTAEVSNCMELAPLGQGTDAGMQLSLLANSTDGCNDQVHAMRDQAGIDADLVQGVVSQFQGSVAGIGYLWQSYCWNNGCNFAPNAFSLVLRGYETYSGTHEMGHNLGCNHNPENAGSSSPILPGGFGHRGTNWRTQMAYASTQLQTRIPYFSNPDLTYNANVIGIPNQRDNAALLRLTIPIAANWRGDDGSPGVPPDPVTNLTATQNLIERIQLTWSMSPQAASYEIFRNATCDGAPLLSTSGTQVADMAPPAFSTLYNYSVRAINANGASACSVSAAGMALAKSTPVQTFLATDGVFDNKVDLTWDAVDPSGTSSLQLFRTMISSSTDGMGCQAPDSLTTLPANISNYSDMTAAADTHYRYSILRINSDTTASDCITDIGFLQEESESTAQTPGSVTNELGPSRLVVQASACGQIATASPVSPVPFLLIIAAIAAPLLFLRRQKN